jgi:MFS family permease
MSDIMPDPTGPNLDVHALDVRNLGRKARDNPISGNALMAVALGLAVFAAALLLWAGIVEGSVRVALLLIAAVILPVRILATQLSAVTPADGIEGVTNSTVRRWLNHWEAAGLLMAGGLCAFGSGHDMGAVMGAVCAALLLLAEWRGPTRSGFLLRLYPTSMLALTAVVSAFETWWGWRGQTFLIGLNVIAVVLIVQVLRRRV